MTRLVQLGNPVSQRELMAMSPPLGDRMPLTACEDDWLDPGDELIYVSSPHPWEAQVQRLPMNGTQFR